MKSSASIRMQRCSISNVLRVLRVVDEVAVEVLIDDPRASGSIQVVTKVARLRCGRPSTASSRSTKRIAASGSHLRPSGMALSGAAVVR